MSDNVDKNKLKRCFSAIASPIPKLPSPTFSAPKRKCNLDKALTDSFDEEDSLNWIDEGVLSRHSNPKMTERENAINLMVRAHSHSTGESAWNVLRRNVEFNMVTSIMTNLFHAESKGKINEKYGK